MPVTRVEELTGFPECLDGRVKTLHPKVHAGLLADLRLDSHRAQLADLGIEPFDLLVSNLYPFTETVASGAARTRASSRSTSADRRWSARRRRTTRRVAVVTSPEPVRRVLAALAEGGFTLAQRQRLAAAAFAHTAAYDVAVAEWLRQRARPTPATEPAARACVGTTWR